MTFGEPEAMSGMQGQGTENGVPNRVQMTD
jgi:hypothetical protein